ncbi:restriction endonuclease [Candidatus Halobeggiatoa sp. HSG11]|nr:restriction endonuclease [Candidatus Halobeggiatoa sp. HSG11]
MIKNFNTIDKLSWSDFEIFVKDVFVAAGWTNAIITKQGGEYKHGDGGVDIFAYKNKRKFAIEVKQRKAGTNVDVKALNQLVTGAKLANVTNMILVTNSYFNSEVRVRALRLGVELIDRDRLQDFSRSQPLGWECLLQRSALRDTERPRLHSQRDVGNENNDAGVL